MADFGFLGFAFAGTMCIVVIFLPLIIRILITVWIVKDARKRGKDSLLVPVILGLGFGVIGLIIWLLIRPAEGMAQPPMQYAPLPAQPPPEQPPPQ